MKKLALKIIVGTLAFFIGITGVFNWFVYPDPLDQVLGTVPPVKLEAITSEDYEVYSAVITELLLKDWHSDSTLIISNRTTFYTQTEPIKDAEILQRQEEDLRELKLRHPDIEEMLSDYHSKAGRPHRLYPDFNLPVSYKLINTKEDEEAFTVMVGLSAIGYNRARNQAYVTIEYYCPTCGFGNTVILEKIDGIWKIKENLGGWIS